MLVSKTDSDLATHARTDGKDILFTDADGVTPVPYELESYGTGTLVAWVKVPSMATSAKVFMYYGNSTYTTPGASPWDSNYKAVWHLKDAGSGTLSTADSTGANNGTPQNNPGVTTGKIGGGATFNGTNQYITAGTSGFSSGGNPTTMEAWVNVLGQGSYTNGTVVVAYGNTAVYMASLNLEAAWNGPEFRLLSGTQAQAVTQSPLTGWHHLAAIITPVSNRSYECYIDGQLAKSGDMQTYGDPWGIDLSNGTIIGGPGGKYSNAVIDEVRVSNVRRSADWMRVQYQNQGSPSTFYTVGTQQ